MDAASGGIAVVSLAGQLLEGTLKLQIFFGKMRDAPSTISTILDDLKTLERLLESISPGEATHADALRECNCKLDVLQSVAEKLAPGFKSSKPWTRYWTYFRTAKMDEQLARMASDLEGMKSTLLVSLSSRSQRATENTHSTLQTMCLAQTRQEKYMVSMLEAIGGLRLQVDSHAIRSSCCSSQLLDRHENAVAQEISRASATMPNGTLQVPLQRAFCAHFQKLGDGNLSDSPPNIEMPSNEDGTHKARTTAAYQPRRRYVRCHQSTYNGLWGTVCFITSTYQYPHSRLLEDFTDQEQNAGDFEHETIFSYRPPAWLVRLGMNCVCRLSIFRKTLASFTFTTRRIIPDDSLIFQYASNGDTEKLVSMFRTGQASPFDETSRGLTLLHVAVLQRHADTCRTLLEWHADKTAPITEDVGILNGVDTKLCRGMLPLTGLFTAHFDDRDYEASTKILSMLEDTPDFAVLPKRHDYSNHDGLYRYPMIISTILASREVPMHRLARLGLNRFAQDLDYFSYFWRMLDWYKYLLPMSEKESTSLIGFTLEDSRATWGRDERFWAHALHANLDVPSGDPEHVAGLIKFGLPLHSTSINSPSWTLRMILGRDMYNHETHQSAFTPLRGFCMWSRALLNSGVDLDSFCKEETDAPLWERAGPGWSADHLRLMIVGSATMWLGYSLNITRCYFCDISFKREFESGWRYLRDSVMGGICAEDHFSPDPGVAYPHNCSCYPWYLSNLPGSNTPDHGSPKIRSALLPTAEIRRFVSLRQQILNRQWVSLLKEYIAAHYGKMFMEDWGMEGSALVKIWTDTPADVNTGPLVMKHSNQLWEFGHEVEETCLHCLSLADSSLTIDEFRARLTDRLDASGQWSGEVEPRFFGHDRRRAEKRQGSKRPLPDQDIADHLCSQLPGAFLDPQPSTHDPLRAEGFKIRYQCRLSDPSTLPPDLRASFEQNPDHYVWNGRAILRAWNGLDFGGPRLSINFLQDPVEDTAKGQPECNGGSETSGLDISVFIDDVGPFLAEYSNDDWSYFCADVQPLDQFSDSDRRFELRRAHHPDM